MNRKTRGSVSSRTKNAGSVSDSRTMVRYGLLIGLLVASIVLLGGAVAIILIAANTAPSFNGVGLDMPYNAEARPLPDTRAANTDLPQSIGAFSRSAISGSVNGLNGSLSATYTNGTASIQIMLDLSANVAQTQADFIKRLSTITRGTVDTRQTANAAYAQAEDPTTHTVRFVYAVQYWLFDLTASSRSALDAFMAAYPY